MLTSVAVGRTIARGQPFHFPSASAYNAILRRSYATPPTPTPSSSNAPPPPPQQTKPKVDLRPGPMKPKATAPPVRKSASNMKQLKAKSPYNGGGASKTAKPPIQPAQPTFTGLGAAKAEAIQDAEAHGILKPPPPGANFFQKTLHQVTELIKFYYRGVKLVWHRGSEISAIRARIDTGGAPLSRAEFRLIATQHADVLKIIPFLLIALILEEIIPLIAIYLPGMLPSTCILPSQQAKIAAKREAKAAAFRVRFKQVFADLKMRAELRERSAVSPTGVAKQTFVVALENLTQVADAPMAICGLLGLSTLGPDFMRMRRLRKHLSFIARDDNLLLREAAHELNERELATALAERGIPSPVTKTAADLQSLLNKWLAGVKDDPEDDVFARRLAIVLAHCP